MVRARSEVGGETSEVRGHPWGLQSEASGLIWPVGPIVRDARTIPIWADEDEW